MACKSGESDHHYNTRVPAILPKNCPEVAYWCWERRWCKRYDQKRCGHPTGHLDMGADKRADIGSIIPRGSSSIPSSYFGPIVGHEHPGP